MKKLTRKTGNILGMISLVMFFLGIIFLGILLTPFGWWLDVALFGPIAKLFHISATFSITILKAYWLIAILLAIISGYFSEKK